MKKLIIMGLLLTLTACASFYGGNSLRYYRSECLKDFYELGMTMEKAKNSCEFILERK